MTRIERERRGRDATMISYWNDETPEKVFDHKIILMLVYAVLFGFPGFIDYSRFRQLENCAHF